MIHSEREVFESYYDLMYRELKKLSLERERQQDRYSSIKAFKNKSTVTKIAKLDSIIERMEKELSFINAGTRISDNL